MRIPEVGLAGLATDAVPSEESPHPAGEDAEEQSNGGVEGVEEES